MIFINELRVNDIADDLLIINKYTIDRLYSLDNCADCIALYVFYYKTAKWQKTNLIKANDTYVKNSLKWGKTKIQKTKETLKNQGLISIVQRRKDNKISGWYIEVHYIMSEKRKEDIRVRVEKEESNNPQNVQVANSTCSSEDTNALRKHIKCLENKIKMLEEEKPRVSPNGYTKSFEEFWKNYPRKKEKARAYKCYMARLNDGYSEEELLTACKNYAYECEKEKTEQRYIKHGSTFLSDSMPFLDYLKMERELSYAEANNIDTLDDIWPD